MTGRAFILQVSLGRAFLSRSLQWGAAGACAQPVDGAPNLGTHDQPPFKPVFSGKVDEDKSDDNRQHALSRGNQHDYPRHKKHDAEQILSKHNHCTKHWISLERL